MPLDKWFLDLILMPAELTEVDNEFQLHSTTTCLYRQIGLEIRQNRVLCWLVGEALPSKS